MNQAAIIAGFDNPVHDSQHCFKQLMSAMAEPGTIQTLAIKNTPDGLHRSSYQLALTLFDTHTRIAVSASLQSATIIDPLVFHCGCSFVDLQPVNAAGENALNENALNESVLNKADFILADISEWSEVLSSSALSYGDPEYPDRSTTLILQVPEIADKPIAGALELVLAGPGIESTRSVSISGLQANIVEQWRQNQQRFPLGIDLLVCAPDALLALPRTCRLEVN